MLVSLRIKNLALVDDLTWEVGPGLVCVTGETGAGKSMIVGALKLILGERADRSLIRTGEESCTVEAVFQLARPEEVNARLAEAGLDACEGDELLIKRVMTAAGQNRQFINNSPATLSSLKEIGAHLVDLHGPHDHQSLLSRDRQRAMLDAFAGAGAAVAAHAEAFAAWRASRRELEELAAAEEATEAELDLLRHQISEIEVARLNANEEEDLLRRHKTAANGSRLLELAAAALQKLADDDDSVLAQLRHVQRGLRELERLDPALAQSLGAGESAFVELEELENTLRDYSDRIDLDPAALAAVEERINVIESLKRKYGGSLEAVVAHHQKASTKLSLIENRGEALAALRAHEHACREATAATASRVRLIREKAAPKLAKQIAAHLLDLGFKQSTFEIRLDPLDEPGPHGTEEIDLMFAPNPGEPLRPLRLVASSGEMSRVMLAVKSALAKQDAIPLLVFDEIDANVGGEIATSVGRKMADLGASHQVVAITHMPQVAALASAHYEVSKSFAEGRTTSTLRPVTGGNRVLEIARMLGGKEKSALEHARTLLGGREKSARAETSRERRD
ncbi:MAG: DNA repair protein RecN [Verrucomicrobiales bacterium]